MICLSNASAQLYIDTSYTPQEMVLDFFSNSCVTPSNIVYTGAPGTYGFFDAGDTDLGVPAGIFLGSGFALDAIGPNDSGGSSGVAGSDGDPDLQSIGGGLLSMDAAVLEMDILATGSQLDFSYVFGSEEYLEFVNTGFNDVFAFFISGPGISGTENIAMVPNTSDPVSINTINDQSNSTYFVDNAGGMDLQFDGYTAELIASVTVTPFESYHVKIAISDIGDAIFDSGIFLGIESLCGDSLLMPPAAFSSNIDGMELALENTSRYATSWLWDFGDNSTSSERNPGLHMYKEEGNYEVTLITQNYCCTDTFVQQIIISAGTSVKDEQVNPIRIFPNPVDDRMHLNFKGEGVYDFRIFSVSGRVKMEGRNKGPVELDMHEFESGLYFLEVKSDGKIFREKIIKS